MQIKRALFWVLLAAFIILPCWWVFHFPFYPKLVCRVVPSDATLATRHIAPAERCFVLMKSPAVTNVAAAVGADARRVSMALELPAVQRLVGILGKRYVATAYVPAMAPQMEPAVLFGAWIGGYSQLLRWGLADRYFSGFSVHRLPHACRVWVKPCDDIKAGYSLSLTVHEGVMVGCFSSEPLGVLYILPRLLRQAPASKLVADWVNGPVDVAGPDDLRFVGFPFSQTFPLCGTLQHVSATDLTMEFAAPHLDRTSPLGRLLPSPKAGLLSAAGRAPLGDCPTLLVEAPVSQIAPSLLTWGAGKNIQGVWSSLQSSFRLEGPAAVFASGGDFYGRIMGMRVPAFGIAMPLAAGVEADAAILEILDVLNAAYGLGLVATPDSRDPRIRVIASVRNSALKRLKGDERLAVAIEDDWLIGVSNVGVLRQMMEPPLSRRARSGECADLCADGSVVTGWANLAESSDLFTKALAGYTLISLLEGGGSAPTKRYDTASLKTAIRVLGEFGDFSAHLRPQSSSLLLHAELSLVP
jgi:hypothetical protein